MPALLPHQVPHVGEAEEQEEDDVAPPDDGVAEEVDAVVLPGEVLGCNSKENIVARARVFASDSFPFSKMGNC